MNKPLPHVFCAIDTTDTARAVNLAQTLSVTGCGIKLGLEYFNAQGPDGIRAVRAAADAPLFLDLKYHDIPNTVAGAVRAACALEPAYMNVHASGGAEMMRAAHDAAGEEAARLDIDAPQILAVTILTSLDDAALADIGYARQSRDQVLRLAELTQAAGLAGIVCSAHEIAAVRAACGPEFILMVPGIRPAGSSSDDQKRIMTPPEALSAGATHLVIGRPITGATDPAAAAREILATL
ncbi:MAG: orotidine-5'-phosphate decarboxylase [Alphaproteobacteria bacterium]|nr:orotidine-5'-phosphate decarboxylase [Alphaproteobacteria bacterium]